MMLSRSIPTLCVVLAIPLWSNGQSATVEATSSFQLRRGLVVEDVSKNSQAEKAGVRTGDILLSWSRAGIEGQFGSPFDLVYAFFEQASKGPVVISGVRGRAQRKWRLNADTWGISVRPNFSKPLLSMYLQGRSLLSAAKIPEATEQFRLVSLSAQSGPSWLAPWLFSHAAEVLGPTDEWNLSSDLYAQAIMDAGNTTPFARAEIFRERAVASAGHQDLHSAMTYYGNVLLECRKLKHQTMLEANTLASLAILELQQGQYDAADGHLRRAMMIGETLAPTSIYTVLVIANLAVLYQDQGQLDKAEEYFLKALGQEQKSFPNSAYLEATLTALGLLFDDEGDLARAEAYYRRALSVAKHLDPNTLDVADILANLAECILQRGNPSKAQAYALRALSIREQRVPNSLPVAYSLATLGKIARIRGDITKAQEYYRRALAMVAKADAPDPDRAKFFMGLAAVCSQKHDFGEAENLYRQALAIIEKEDPGSIDRTTTLGDLAGTLYRQNRLDEAAGLYREALSTLEERSSHLGAVDESRSYYRAEHMRYYAEYTRLLIEQGQPEQAFAVLEAARARTLLEMLRQGHVEIDHKPDPVLHERELSLQRTLNAKTEYRIRVAAENPADPQLAAIDRVIDDLLLEYQQVQAQLRGSRPRYAALAQPEQLGVKDIQRLLDPDTLLLEYSLAEEGSYLWALSDRSLNVFALPRRSAIEAAARQVYTLLTLTKETSEKTALNEGSSEREYTRAARNLSEMVLGPVAQLLGGKRLVFVSDGALQYIPFSALPAPGTNVGDIPLIVKHEIVNLPSASILAELRRQETGRPKAANAVAVLADPVFDAEDERLAGGNGKDSASRSSFASSDLNRSAADLGLTRGGKAYLSRLLYTRNEAVAVMSVTPPGKGMLALDFEANRRTATSPALAKYRIIHFATHGILDNRHPELSGLVLSLVNKKGKAQDGFLKLQDIYGLKLPVELVVLSGCQTGLGEQINGEGLIGLTRGFMYAGASRVVASLWSVSDIATASLMADFYEAMERDGMRPAAALRAAQLRMWKQKQWSFPYYWAGFEIQGEWK